MPEEPTEPWVVSLSRHLVRLAAHLVPAGQREEWLREWNAEIWHRWQFLFHTREWTRREKLLLLRSSVGAFADAAWILAGQSALRARISQIARSPFTCLAGFAVVLTLIAVCSSGLPATREMLFSQMPGREGDLTFIWLHHYIGGDDKGLPSDVVPAWDQNSKLLNGVAGLNVRHTKVTFTGWKRQPTGSPLVVTTNPSLFHLLGVHASLGQLPVERGVVLDQRAFAQLARRDPRVIGAKVRIFGLDYQVAAVLPNGFEFLSRQPTVYLVDRVPPVNQMFVVARVKNGVGEARLSKELAHIAEEICSYYSLQSQMRFSHWRGALLTPLVTFGIASLLSCVLAWLVFRPRTKLLRMAFEPAHRKAAAQRALFFSAKTVLGLACVFLACLEWSRSESSVLLASRDPANGPFLLWLFVLGTMGVLFWAVADQRARCRVCLRLMAFPVRIGCPGCLLLDWSGTELFCSEGHGLLHVPLMAPSWDEEADRWVALDDSWRGLFAHEK